MDLPLTVSHHHVDAGLRAIVQGVGCVGERLSGELDAIGIGRPMLLCGANLRASSAFDDVTRVLHARGDVVVFDGCRPHSPSEAIEDAAAQARAAGVDGIVALGGSSAIDAAKGVAVLLGTGADAVAALTPPARGAMAVPMVAPPGTARVPVLTLTTTLSYAEFFPFWGTRRADTGAKAGYGDHGVVSRTIFLDGALAATTPDPVWAETAVKSFDDALLVHLRSGGDEPFLDPLLVAGMRGVLDHLPASVRDRPAAERADARQRVLTAMALTKWPLPRLQPGFASDWFARAVRYALGSRFDAPHGVGTCIAMTEGLRFHLATTARRQDDLAKALGLAPAAGDGHGALVAALDALTARLDLPRSLDALGLSDAEVALVVDDIAVSMPGLGGRRAIAAAVDRIRRR